MSTSTSHGTGGMVQLDADQLAQLRMQFRGELLTPGEPDYDAARAVQNLAIDRHPGLIIRCSGEADVIDGVNLAREHHLLLAVRAGGHHVAGHGSVDGGLVLDLRDMNGVWVNPARRTVHVQGGATWGQVDRETQVFGLAVPGGVVSTTGVGGLTLGGGIGWLHRRWGLACDNLLSATVVLADGSLVTASADEHPDLFWAIRGGGGNFGIVVDFTFEAHPVGPEVALAAVFHPIEAGADLLPQWRDLALAAPDEVTTRAMYWSMPPSDELPPPIQGQDVLIIAAMYAGDATEGAEAIRPFRELGAPMFDMTEFIPDYRAFQAGFDALASDLHAYWKSLYLNELDDEALAFIHAQGMSRPDPATLIHIPIMGGATARVAPDATAFGDRGAPFMLSFDAQTRDPSNYATVREWARTTSEAARSLNGARGAYLNFSGDEATDTRVLDQQYGQNMSRLRAIKKQYDPHNLFCVNNNITPAA
ncbi:FAD-binding oxidoreductase [Demequina zhanjiangensis]|uniref:FAD-binding oxidoreductase n=1 Tax=Demequina zhanjiangensis TaxID=3051659 RepID=A0ABT8G272_9MICO|nr:FAD-binding oxidoreductase [Demequina sp. SYSU T00b26]MDN4473225.1 FAD-binding oxidoreductase [Demequina sp. SYSU T00b26]